MTENNKFSLKNHDYVLNKGDRLLALIRKGISSAELRHQALFPLAHLAPVLGYKSSINPKLSYEVHFKDGSQPLKLSNPFILAAGANKTGYNIVQMANLGFGGVTVGTATRNFRKGNTHRPRVGTIEADRSIHNSMGLNNPGIKAVASRVEQSYSSARRRGLSVGLSIAETPGVADENLRLTELLECFKLAYQTADYVEINVSCPNTGVARGDLDTSFTAQIFAAVQKFRSEQQLRKPVFAKFSPDLSAEHLRSLLDVVQEYGISGVVLNNTFPTLQAQELLQTSVEALPVLADNGAKGGLSGRALYGHTYRAVQFVKANYPDLAIIASGGVDHGAKAWDLLRLGADAVQCYSVLAFRWFAVWQMRRELLDSLQASSHLTLADALNCD